MKKINSITLTIITCMAIICMSFAYVMSQPTTVQADDTIRYDDKDYQIYTSEDYNYILVNKEIVIMQYNGTNSSVTIPSEINGYPVTVIGCRYDKGAFQDNGSMQTVTIPSSIKRIEKNAFKNCTGLQQVLVGNKVNYIGESSFESCENLKRIQFNGDSLEVIDNRAFCDCDSLESFDLSDNLVKLGDSAFSYCETLSYMKLPDSVTELGAGVFRGCTSLKEVAMGNGITALNAYYNMPDDSGANWDYEGIFEGCVKLTKVTLSNKLTYIGIDAFCDTAITEIIIPNTVKRIDDGAFYKCSKLEKVEIGKNVKTIGILAFKYNYSLKEIFIPSSVNSLGAGCFYMCTSLQKAIIGNGVTNLTSCYNMSDDTGADWDYEGTFEKCSNLEEVIIGDGIKTIGVDAFANTKVNSINIPDSVTKIELGAFYNCDALKTVYFGKCVTNIGERAFYSNDSLNEIHMNKSIISIGDAAFAHCTSMETIVIPSSVTELGGGICSGNTSLKTAIIGNGVTALNSYYNMSDDNGADWDYEGMFEGCLSLNNVTIGRSVESISSDTFTETSISYMLLPDKINSINDGAFYNSNFAKIYFTGNAPSMGENLFGSSQFPQIYKLSNKTGYDNWEYIVHDYTPITITFDLNSSEVFAIHPFDQYLSPEGGYVIEPIDPVAEGYVFGGWYEDSACTSQWNFIENKVTTDTTIYAKWDKIDEIAPEPPENLEKVSATSNSIVLNWSKVTGATGYLVYVDGSLVTSDAISGTSYTITGLNSDTAYEINVIAVNDAGESKKSLTKVISTEVFSGNELGDVNGDTLINASDALAVLKHAAKLAELNDIEQVAANVTKDDTINANDALQILKYAAKLIDNF